MGKIQPKQLEKNEGKIFPVKTPKKQGKKSKEKTPKNELEKNGNSRTMQWLKIPQKTKEKFKRNVIAVKVDYLQYTCYKITHPLQNLYNILGFSGNIDQDNSNIEYNFNMNLSLTSIHTQMGRAYMITFFSPGFPPIPIGSVEVYSEDKEKLLKTQGKIVFYGSFFVFKEILKNEVPEVIRFFNSIEFGTKVQASEQKPMYKRTRADIAIDVGVPVSQKWLYQYIQPHKNSKHVPKPYNYQPEMGGFQSIGYIPRLSRGIGIRVYNKILDIMSKNKQAWYPHYGSEDFPIVTRMEIIFAGNEAQDTIENIIKYSKFRILGTDEIELKRKVQPKSQYSAKSAYEHFKKYAKNHGKTLRQVLDDVTLICISEELKDRQFEI